MPGFVSMVPDRTFQMELFANTFITGPENVNRAALCAAKQFVPWGFAGQLIFL
jgi:hypothetical protein